MTRLCVSTFKKSQNLENMKNENIIHAMTPKKGLYFIVNEMFNFAQRYIGKGHSAEKNPLYELTLIKQFSTLEKTY